MDVSLKDLPPPTLVETDDGLDELLDVIDEQEIIAVDTEADSFYSYRDKVCLFQVTAGERDWLVDPFAGLDLSELGEVLADPSIEKVFHDAEYDVLILKKEYGFNFRSLFDTRVAAAILGVEAPGLAAVLRSRFGVELDKSQQRSNWAKRPLSAKQIAYARLDTRFLIALKEEQEAELEKRGLRMILDTECRRLEALDAPEGGTHPDDFVRIKGARSLDGQGASALRELFAMRERMAEKLDLPPFRILGNKTMIEIAERLPRNEKELLRVDGVTPKVLSRVGDRIRRALDKAERRGPLGRLPTPPKRPGGGGLDDVGSELHDRLKKVRRDASENEGIESAYLLNRHVLIELSKKRPRSLDEIEDLKLLDDWQIDRYGRDLARTIDTFEQDLAAGVIPTRRRPSRRGRVRRRR